MKKLILSFAVTAALFSCTQKEDPKPIDPRDKFTGTWSGNLITSGTKGTTSSPVTWLIQKNGNDVMIFFESMRIPGTVSGSVLATDLVGVSQDGVTVRLKQGNVYYKNSYLDVNIPISVTDNSTGVVQNGSITGNLNKQ